MPTRVPGVLPLPSSPPPSLYRGYSYLPHVPGVLPSGCARPLPLPAVSRCTFPLYRGYSKGLRGKEVLKDFRV